MKFYLFMGILFCLSGSCRSQDVEQLITKDDVPLDPTVRHGQLKNGFTYYLKDIESPQNEVQFRLVTKAGWDHEDPDQREYAHLLEHLLAKETKNFPDLGRYFYDDGRRRQAFTRKQSTEYIVTIPRKDKHVFSDGLQVLFDWTQGNQWNPESIAVERGAVEGEMRTTDPYQEWKTRSMERVVLETMGYSPVDIRKSLESIKNFESDAFYRFYESWYRPDLQAAIIVGNIDLDSLEGVIKRKFGVLKRSSLFFPDPSDYLDAQKVHFDGENHFETIEDSLASKIELEIFRVRPNFQKSPKSVSDFRILLLQQLYTNVLDQRSKSVSQQYDSPFSYFWAEYRSGSMAGGQVNATLMTVGLSGNNLDIQKQFQRGIKAWKKLHMQFTKPELEEAKNELLGMFNFGQSKTVTDFAIKFKDHFVDGKAAPQPEVEEKLIKNLLNGISLRDLEKFAQENGNLNENTHFIFFKGNKTRIPEYKVFERWKEEVDAMDIEPLDAPAPLIESLDNVGLIPASLSMEKIKVTENTIGVSTVTLQNGVQILLKPTQPSSRFFRDRISIKAFRPNPVPIENDQDYLAAQVVPEVITYNGAGPYTKFDLERFTSKKRMNLYFEMNKNDLIISGDSYVKDLSELLNLTYLYLYRPRRDEKAFQLWKELKKKKLSGKDVGRSVQFIMDKIENVWYPEVPRLDEQDLKDLKEEKLFGVAEKYFSTIEGYTFIVTGDFDKDDVLPVLVRKLSGFPINERMIKARSKELEFPMKRMEEKLECKNIDAAFVRLFFPVRVEKDLKTKIELRLFNRALNERIHARLRKGSYVPISQGMWIDEENGIFSFQIIFDSALGEQDKMINWALEEFRKLREDGVEKEWLENAIIQESSNYDKGLDYLSYNNFWQDYLQSKIEPKQDLEREVLQFNTILKHFISHQDFQKDAKKFLKEENLQQFIAVPEKKSELSF